MTARFALPHAPASATAARHALLAELAAHDVDPAARDDAALVLSELVGNAVRHARSRADGVVVHWRPAGDGQLLLEVSDGGGKTMPQRRDPDTTGSSGRGLAIVTVLAGEWGVRADGDTGRTVWAVLSLRGGDAPAGAGAGSAKHFLRHEQHRDESLSDGGERLVG